MKLQILFISLSILLTLGVSAQIDIDKSKINPAYLKFLPSNANPEDLRPSDIPSEQVLKQMGLSDNEIADSDISVVNWNMYQVHELTGDKKSAKEYLENSYLEIRSRSKNIKNKDDRNQYLSIKLHQDITAVWNK